MTWKTCADARRSFFGAMQEIADLGDEMDRGLVNDDEIFDAWLIRHDRATQVATEADMWLTENCPDWKG